jgi:hypothetical protein
MVLSLLTVLTRKSPIARWPRRKHQPANYFGRSESSFVVKRNIDQRVLSRIGDWCRRPMATGSCPLAPVPRVLIPRLRFGLV